MSVRWVWKHINYKRRCAGLGGLAATGCLMAGSLGCPSSSSTDPDLVLSFNLPDAGTTSEPRGVPFFQSRAVFEQIAGKAGSHAATLTALPSGELIAAWYSYVGPHELNGAEIWMSRLRAGEASWQSPWLHVGGSDSRGNPVLYSEGERVWLFHVVAPLGWSSAGVVFQISEDGGYGWTEPQWIRTYLGTNVRFPPVRRSDGLLLLPAYGELALGCDFFASQDGRDWSSLSSLRTEAPHECIQPSVVRLGDGRLLAVMRNVGSGWQWVTASDDGGRSWAIPQDSGFPNPDSACQLVSLANGHLLLVFNDSNAGRRPLSVALSLDEGLHWPYGRVIADGDSTYSYPTAVQAPDGLIHMVYSHGREHIEHAVFNEAWIAAGR